MDEREIIYWDDEGEEWLTHDDMDDAIESILDDMAPSPLPSRIEICGYALMVVKIATGALEDVLENLDMKYGNPDGDPKDPTPKMVLAEEMFLDVVSREYECWTCEIVERREIDVAEWVKSQRPDWLEDGVEIEGKEEEPGT